MPIGPEHQRQNWETKTKLAHQDWETKAKLGQQNWETKTKLGQQNWETKAKLGHNGNGNLKTYNLHQRFQRAASLSTDNEGPAVTCGQTSNAQCRVA